MTVLNFGFRIHLTFFHVLITPTPERRYLSIDVDLLLSDFLRAPRFLELLTSIENLLVSYQLGFPQDSYGTQQKGL